MRTLNIDDAGLGARYICTYIAYIARIAYIAQVSVSPRQWVSPPDQ